jgi:hypothetical protein
MGEKREKARPLSGWKEIANHLHQGVRTAQRWEKQLGLPVHRIKASGPVVAFAEELNAWEVGKPTHLLDLIAELKVQIKRLEAEVLALKRERQTKKRATAA